MWTWLSRTVDEDDIPQRTVYACPPGVRDDSVVPYRCVTYRRLRRSPEISAQLMLPFGPSFAASIHYLRGSLSPSSLGL
jgi:hypothetical protein